MATHREVVWLGRDNTVDLILKADGSAHDLSSATTIEVVFSGVTLSSTTNSSWFDWTSEGLTTGEVNLKLGSAGSSISPGTYDAELIVYDSDYTNGIMWGEVPIIVKG